MEGFAVWGDDTVDDVRAHTFPAVGDGRIGIDHLDGGDGNPLPHGDAGRADWFPFFGGHQNAAGLVGEVDTRFGFKSEVEEKLLKTLIAEQKADFSGADVARFHDHRTSIDNPLGVIAKSGTAVDPKTLTDIEKRVRGDDSGLEGGSDGNRFHGRTGVIDIGNGTIFPKVGIEIAPIHRVEIRERDHSEDFAGVDVLDNDATAIGVPFGDGGGKGFVGDQLDIVVDC